MTILILSGCNLFPPDEVEQSDDFFGLELNSKWTYNQQTIFTDENGEEEWLGTQVKEVVHVEKDSDGTIYYVEQNHSGVWDDEPYDFFFGTIIDKVGEAYYEWGTWWYNNGDTVTEPYDNTRFIISTSMTIGNLGFTNMPLIGKEERITVSAGVYDTWHFKLVNTVGDTRIAFEKWVAPYVGIVKEKVKIETRINDTWEPWETTTIELVEFNP